ncbi:MAG: hypothetical protein D6729_10585 [Deltaproteobacteria bacterium]|nr:MAG: hypothetical protein D6729_10585 [Deltaproteobacteria bacterium]
MASEGAKPTQSDLAALEQAFAADPKSDAYQPLAEAYLALGRFMEAMVVCKKGVKGHPEDPAAHCLLAKVYARQSKHKKALDELARALEIDAACGPAHALKAEILLEQGEMDAGAEHLKRAADAMPDDEGVREALRKWGIDYEPPSPAPEPTAAPAEGGGPPQGAGPPAAAPEATAETAAPPAPVEDSAGGAPGAGGATPSPTETAVAGPTGASQGSAIVDATSLTVPGTQPVPGAPQAPGVGAAPAAAAVAPPSAEVVLPEGPPPGYGVRPPVPAPEPAGAAAAAPGTVAQPATPPGGPPPPAGPPPLAEDDDFETGTGPIRVQGTKRGGMRSTLLLVLVGLLGLGGFGVWYTNEAATKREIARLLKEAQKELSHDSYAAYKQASETCEKILELDPDQFAAHAYLAYIDVLRWGEHGEGDVMLQSAERHLAAAKAHGKEHSHLIAAQAYYDFFKGNEDKAIDDLTAILERPGTTSGLLSGTLGIIQMWAGRLDDARKSLIRAQELSPGEPRILAALAELARRRGRDAEAARYYENALNFDPHHVDSLLGAALLIIENDAVDNARAEQFLKKVEEMPGDQKSPRQQAMYHFARAQLLYAQGKTQEARAAEEKAKMLLPNNADFASMIARREFRAGHYDAAVDAIREAIRIEPKRATFYVQLARILLAKPGGEREAIEALEKARAQLPDNVDLLMLLGEANAKARRWDAALAAYEKVKALKGDRYGPALLAIGTLERKRRNFEAAKKTLTQAAEAFVDPTGKARANLELARIAIAERDDAAARKLLERALRLDPSLPDTYFFLGQQLAGDRRGRATAKEFLQIYLKRDPSGPYAERARGLMRRL